MENEGFFTIERKRFVLGILMLAMTLALFLALASDGFDAAQSSGRPIDGMLAVPNRLFAPGAFVAGALALVVGDAAHLIYVVTFIWSLKLLIRRPIGRLMTRLVGLVVLLGAVAGLLHIDVHHGFSNTQPGGAFGAFIAERILFPRFAVIGSNVIGGIVAIIGMLLATDFLFIHFFVFIHRFFLGIFRGIWYLVLRGWDGFFWLLGEPRTAEPDACEDALKPITDFCEQIPESAFPPAEQNPAPAGWFARGFEFLKLRLLGHSNLGDDFEPAPGQQATLPLEEPALATALAGSSAGSTRAPLRVHVRQSEPPSSADESSPFGEIPDLNLMDRRPSAVPGTGQQKDLFEIPETLDERESADDDDSGAWEDDGPQFDAEEQDIRGALRLETAVPKTVNPKKVVPRLKRKPTDADELPDDYEYPPQYTSPPLNLFAAAERRIIPNLREKLGEMASQLEDTLRTFNLEARVTDVTRGPTITRFELEPAPGMKVARFLSLTDDIALALKAKGVRVEAPIPGKGRVGIEISNEDRDPVVIRELLEHPIFSKQGAGLELALGKDIAGDICIADLMRMPHLLVAGATGAGKTVCIKALLASLLFHHTPDELQLMLIDPKMVELSIFNDIPHLITPVVTDPKKASAALQWLITEMEERYRLFADLRVRNIEVYNASVENGEIEMEGSEGTRKSQSFHVVRKLPFIVCIIDELADLMMLARAEVEDAIMRLAQLARAVGIHLIIATQRPSVDVLTGVIKANFPARISFQVSSRVDSRCILDEIGAERLVGMGDMLYLPAGQSKPARIQGAFVSDSEMLALIAYLKRQAPPQYRDEIENFGKKKESMDELEQEDDPLLEDAVRVVLDTGQASISMVQRRLRVGYTRAARLIDMMELKGIVGPHTGSKAREILVTTPTKDE